jgi:RNA polymerase sigma factor FliA
MVENDPEVQAEISRLVTEIMPQARGEAWRVWQRAPHALELDELHSLALSGLAHAAARWQEYCASRGHDPHATNYFGAYATQRMRGSMLDAMRSQDWVTRSARTKAKQLREAGQDLGRTDEELARATGMSVKEVRETMAVVASKPVSIDAEPHDVADQADVEGMAVVASVLYDVDRVCRSLPPGQQAVLALHYFHGVSFPEIASSLDVKEETVHSLHQEAVLKVHEAMVRAVALCQSMLLSEHSRPSGRTSSSPRRLPQSPGRQEPARTVLRRFRCVVTRKTQRLRP